MKGELKSGKRSVLFVKREVRSVWVAEREYKVIREYKLLKDNEGVVKGGYEL